MHTILIVGQGLVGTMFALQCLKNNIDFTIISASKYSQCSRVAAGIINPINFYRITSTWRAREFLTYNNKFYYWLNQYANKTFYRDLSCVKIFTSEAETTKWKQKQNDEEYIEYISVCNDTQYKDICTPYGYGYVSQCGHLDILKMIQWFAQVFNNNIVNEKFDPKALNLEHLTYHHKKYSAIVFCEGYRVAENPWFGYLKMKPVKGELLTVQNPNLKISCILNKSGYVLPLHNNQYTIGATYEWDQLNEQGTTDAKNILYNKWNQITNQEALIIDHLAGIRPASADRKPYLGHHPIYKRLWVCNGMGTKGAIQSPLCTALLLAAIINGDTIDKEINCDRKIAINKKLL